jgi:hypothetical protein
LDKPPKHSSLKLTQNALLEQRERAAADLVKVLTQVKEELARARELLARIGRERNGDLPRLPRRMPLLSRGDNKLGPAAFQRGDEG